MLLLLFLSYTCKNIKYTQILDKYHWESWAIFQQQIFLLAELPIFPFGCSNNYVK